MTTTVSRQMAELARWWDQYAATTVEGVEAFSGTVTYKAPSDDSPGKVPLYEHTWNHTTLQQLKVDRGLTYLQCLYPHDRIADAVAEVRKKFEGEVMQHRELVRGRRDEPSGRVTTPRRSVLARLAGPLQLQKIADLRQQSAQVEGLGQECIRSRRDSHRFLDAA